MFETFTEDTWQVAWEWAKVHLRKKLRMLRSDKAGAMRKGFFGRLPTEFVGCGCLASHHLDVVITINTQPGWSLKSARVNLISQA